MCWSYNQHFPSTFLHRTGAFCQFCSFVAFFNFVGLRFCESAPLRFDGSTTLLLCEFYGCGLMILGAIPTAPQRLWHLLFNCIALFIGRLYLLLRRTACVSIVSESIYLEGGLTTSGCAVALLQLCVVSAHCFWPKWLCDRSSLAAFGLYGQGTLWRWAFFAWRLRGFLLSGFILVACSSMALWPLYVCNCAVSGTRAAL